MQRIRGFISNVWYNAAQTILYIVGWIGLMLYCLCAADDQLAGAAADRGPADVPPGDLLRPAYREARTREDDLITALQENIAGSRGLRPSAAQREEIGKFNGLSSPLYDRVMPTVDLFRTICRWSAG